MKRIFLLGVLWCFISVSIAQKDEPSEAPSEDKQSGPSWQNYFNWKQWQDETNKKYENPTQAGLEDWKQWNTNKLSTYSDWGQYTVWQSQYEPKSTGHGGSASSNPTWGNWQSYLSQSGGDASASNDWIKQYGGGSGADWNKYANKEGLKRAKDADSGHVGGNGAAGYDWNKYANKEGLKRAKDADSGHVGGNDWSKWTNGEDKKYPPKPIAAFANVDAAVSDLEKMDDNTLASHYQQYGNWKDWMQTHKQGSPQGDSFQNWLMWKQDNGFEGSDPSWGHLQSYKNWLESSESYASGGGGGGVGVMADALPEDAEKDAETKKDKKHKRKRVPKDDRKKEETDTDEPLKKQPNSGQNVSGEIPPNDWRSNVPPEYRNFTSGTDWQKYIPEDYRNFTAGGPSGNHPSNGPNGGSNAANGGGDWRSFIPKQYRDTQDTPNSSEDTADTDKESAESSPVSDQPEEKDFDKYPWLRYVPENFRKQALEDSKKQESTDAETDAETEKDKKPKKKPDAEKDAETEKDKKHKGKRVPKDAETDADAEKDKKSKRKQEKDLAKGEPNSFSAVSDSLATYKFSTDGIVIFFGLLILGAFAIASAFYCNQIRKRREYEDVDRLLLV